METRAHPTPGAALLLRLAFGAALGLAFVVASLIFGSSSARADDAPEPGLVQGLVDTVLPADSTLGSVVNTVTAKPVAVVDRVVEKPVAVVKTVVQAVVVDTVVEPVLEPETTAPVTVAAVAEAPAAAIPATESIEPVEAASAPAPAEDHATPAEAPAAPGDSTLSPSPALGAGANGGGVVGDLGDFGVRGPVASRIAFSPQGFSPPGAPTFASDVTPD